MKTNIRILISIITLITSILWIQSIPQLPQNSQAPLRLVSQLIACLTVVYMALSLIFSMRIELLDKLLGGLPISYKIHAFIGSLAFIFMIAHPLLLVLHALPDSSRAFGYVFPGGRLAANLGISAVYIAIFSFTFMTFLKIPYQHWLTTHRLLGISFLLGAIHAYLAPSNLFRCPFLSGWLAFWIILGLTGAIYSILLYRRFGSHYPYTISSVETLGDILNITLSPTKTPIEFTPGQFIYIRFNTAHLGSELHPFSPSSTALEPNIRLSIKKIGDFTQKLQEHLKIGDPTQIYGPFGSFGQEYTTGKSDMIWVGGGIGITPFLSMLRFEYMAPTNKKILLVYSLNKPEEAVFDKELTELNKKLPNLTYIKWIANESGFLTTDILLNKWKALPSSPSPKIFLCGPPVMTQALLKQAIALHLSPQDIIFEEFSFI